MYMIKKIGAAAFAAAAMSVVLWASGASAASFTHAEVEPDIGATLTSTGTGLVSVDAGSGNKARADVGVNGVAASSAYAMSIWADDFTVTGGTGTGMLNLSVRINGTLTPNSGDAIYALLASSSPFTTEDIADWLDGDIATRLNTQFLLEVEMDDTPDSPHATHTLPSGTHDVTYYLNIPFEYGTPFYLTSVLDIDGVGDFYNSAHFGITVPTGATLQAASGAVYSAAATVPEPSTWLLLGAGLAGLVGMRKRFAGSARGHSASWS